jgi:hypothetical protein
MAQTAEELDKKEPNLLLILSQFTYLKNICNLC